MFTLSIVLAIIASVLLIFAVLIQNSKGGGISADFSAANQIAGVKKTNEFIEKATWTLAVVLLVMSITSRFFYGTGSDNLDNEFLDRMQDDAGPAFVDPTTAPAPAATEGGDGQIAPVE